MKRTMFASLLALAITPAFAQNINTIAGNGIAGNSGDGGQALAAGINTPTSVEPIPGGGYYIGTQGALRQVDAAGVITTLYETSGEFIGAILLAPDGNLYFTNHWGNMVFRRDSGGTINYVTTTSQGTAGLAMDASGNLYVADYYGCRVYKVTDPAGTPARSEFAGTGACTTSAGENVSAATATLNKPTGLTFDEAGNLYVSEYDGGRVRRIDLGGNVSTLAGSAGIEGPWGIDVDADGNVYVAAFVENRVYRVTPAGVRSVVAGTGTGGFFGDGGPAVDARLNTPTGLALDAGRLLIADHINNRVRAVDIPPDNTLPEITPIIVPAAPDGSNGWYVTSVGLGWDVTDEESEVTSTTGCEDVVLDFDTGSAGMTYSCTATSAGGTAGPVNVVLKRDATPPTLAPTVPSPLLLGQSYSASANASDATSGLASASCGALDTGSLGSKSTTCSATDIAGNTKTVTLAYTVTTTCSNDGYTGTQLTWCRNICEMGYTGNTQDMWLRRWITRFHDKPYCMAEPQPALY